MIIFPQIVWTNPLTIQCHHLHCVQNCIVHVAIDRACVLEYWLILIKTKSIAYKKSTVSRLGLSTICPKKIPFCYSTMLPNTPYYANYFHLLFSNKNLKVKVFVNPNKESVTDSLKGNQLLNTFCIVTLLMLQCNLLNRDECCQHADIM